MYQLNLLLLRIELQAPAEHDFDLQPTANLQPTLFIMPFWGLL